jgi:hypothetical protein
MGGSLNNILRLRSDRFFSERIMGKYAGMRNRFPAMPQMIFGEKASRFFSFRFRLNMLLAFPVQVMNRYSLYRKDIYPSFDPTAFGPFFTTIPSPVFSDSVRQGSHWKQVVQNILTAHGAIAASSRLSYARTGANAVKQVFNSFVSELLAMFGHPSPAAVQRGSGETRTRYGSPTRNERFFASFAKQFSRHAHRTFVDEISKRQSMLREELKRRHEMLVVALQSGTAGIHAASEPSRESLTEKAQELIFRGTDKIEQEIDELKRIVKKTEDRVHEKVARQLREIVTERNRQVDVGTLTLEVYRNMERMIRIERERRGM